MNYISTFIPLAFLSQFARAGFNQLIQDKDGSLLRDAVKSKRLDLVRERLSQGDDAFSPDVFGVNAVEYAKLTDQWDVYRFLLKETVARDVEIADQELESQGALVERERAAILQRVAEQWKEERELPPLHRSVVMGDVSKMEMALLINQSHVNQPDDAGIYPIHYALALGHLQIAQRLIEEGADLSQKVHGVSALALFGHQAMAKDPLAVNKRQIASALFSLAWWGTQGLANDATYGTLVSQARSIVGLGWIASSAMASDSIIDAVAAVAVPFVSAHFPSIGMVLQAYSTTQVLRRAFPGLVAAAVNHYDWKRSLLAGAVHLINGSDALYKVDNAVETFVKGAHPPEYTILARIKEAVACGWMRDEQCSAAKEELTVANLQYECVVQTRAFRGREFAAACQKIDQITACPRDVTVCEAVERNLDALAIDAQRGNCTGKDDLRCLQFSELAQCRRYPEGHVKHDRCVTAATQVWKRMADEHCLPGRNATICDEARAHIDHLNGAMPSFYSALDAIMRKRKDSTLPNMLLLPLNHTVPYFVTSPVGQFNPSAAE